MRLVICMGEQTNAWTADNVNMPGDKIFRRFSIGQTRVKNSLQYKKTSLKATSASADVFTLAGAHRRSSKVIGAGRRS